MRKNYTPSGKKWRLRELQEELCENKLESEESVMGSMGSQESNNLVVIGLISKPRFKVLHSIT